MKNQVIEALDIEHGKKVIEYWESKGVATLGMYGSLTKKDGEDFRYYGVINNRFNCYTIEFVNKHNAEIIELPTEYPKEEKPFPGVMLVSDDGNSWHRRVVFMKRCGRYISWIDAETIEESENIYKTTSWRYAKELTEKVIISKAEIAEKFGVPFDYIKIVD